MIEYEDIILRKAQEKDKSGLYELVTSDEEWTKFDGPYFPYKTPTLAEFENGFFKDLCEGQRALLIEYQGLPVGCVSFYWENKRTRWLEAGIIIYDHKAWNKKIGRKALIPWITHIFNTHEIERVGMTTWSGNPRMISCAQSIGLSIEATLRKVRYYQGEYHDSIKLGVLREEWFQQNS